MGVPPMFVSGMGVPPMFVSGMGVPPMFFRFRTTGKMPVPLRALAATDATGATFSCHCDQKG